MKIQKVTSKEILKALGEELDETNKKPFLDLNGQEVKQGDFVIVARKMASGFWLSYGLVLENAGYWDNFGWGPKYYQSLLKVKCVDEEEVEIESVESNNQVVKVAKKSIPKNVLTLLES